MGARLPERPTPPPPPASGVPQVLVALQSCMHCNQSVGPDDLSGICLDCWEEISAESLYCLSVPAVRYLDYVLKEVKLKLKAKTKMTRIPLGPFSLEALKQLRDYILSTHDYQDMSSEFELVQTKGIRCGAGPFQWELRFAEPSVLDVVLGPALIDNLESHLNVAGAGKLFGNGVFAGSRAG